MEKTELLKKINDFYKKGIEETANGNKTSFGMFSGMTKGVFKKVPFGIGYLLEANGTLLYYDFNKNDLEFQGIECRENEYIKLYHFLGQRKIYEYEQSIYKNGYFIGEVGLSGEHTGEYRDNSGISYSGTFSAGMFTSLTISNNKKAITSKDNEDIFTITYPNGDKYIGTLKNGAKSGTGSYIWKNGDRFDGEWRNNKRNGKGTMSFADGKKYEGEYVDDNKQGHGSFTWFSGKKYEGDWVNNKKNGIGELTSEDGRKYLGLFTDDRLIATSDDDFVKSMKIEIGTYSGEIKNCKPFGKGKCFFDDFSQYEGDWVDGKMQGVGTMISLDGNKYEGDWADNKKNGNGVLYYNNNCVYIGEFKDDIKEGVGALINLENHSFYYGELKNDKFNGKGYFYNETGESFEAEWKNGKIIKKENYGLKKLWENKINELKNEMKNIESRKDYYFDLEME